MHYPIPDQFDNTDIGALFTGFGLFREENQEKLVALSRGQNPHIMIIGCSDSRADPALITRADPGDLFVHRNIANLVPPCHREFAHHCTGSVLEYGVVHLRVSHIIVKGHSDCGGIKGLMTGSVADSSFIGTWLKGAAATRDKVCARHNLHQEFNAVSAEILREAERANVVASLENLMTYDFVNERVTDKSLILHGWYFNIDRQQLEAYDPQRRDWRACTEQGCPMPSL